MILSIAVAPATGCRVVCRTKLVNFLRKLTGYFVALTAVEYLLIGFPDQNVLLANAVISASLAFATA